MCRRQWRSLFSRPLCEQRPADGMRWMSEGFPLRRQGCRVPPVFAWEIPRQCLEQVAKLASQSSAFRSTQIAYVALAPTITVTNRDGNPDVVQPPQVGFAAPVQYGAPVSHRAPTLTVTGCAAPALLQHKLHQLLLFLAPAVFCLLTIAAVQLLPCTLHKRQTLRYLLHLRQWSTTASSSCPVRCTIVCALVHCSSSLHERFEVDSAWSSTLLLRVLLMRHQHLCSSTLLWRLL